MSPQSAKMETRRGRWSDVNRERRVLWRRPVKFDEIGVLLCWGERRQDRQNSARVGVGEANCEVERDEKEVDGVGHAEGDEVDDLEVQLD